MGEMYLHFVDAVPNKKLELGVCKFRMFSKKTVSSVDSGKKVTLIVCCLEQFSHSTPWSKHGAHADNSSLIVNSKIV